MTAPPYRNPTLVETIISGIVRYYGEDKARKMLAEGVEADQIYRILCYTGVDPCAMTFAALTSGDFATVPRIGRIRAVKLRLGGRIGDTTLRRCASAVVSVTRL